MVDITESSAIDAAVGVLVGVIYYIQTIRHQKKVRQTDLTLRVWQATCTEEIVRSWHTLLSAEYDDLEDFTKKARAKNQRQKSLIGTATEDKLGIQE